MFFHPEYILKNFTLIPKTGKDITRKLQISFMNIDIEIWNKIQANQSSTLKGLYTMTKWDLLLEFENGSTEKLTSMIRHLNRMKEENPKPAFSLSSLTFIKKFSSSSLSAIRVMICIFEVVDISGSNLDSSLWFIQPGISHDEHCILCFPGGTSDKEPTCQWRRHKKQVFDP